MTLQYFAQPPSSLGVGQKRLKTIYSGANADATDSLVAKRNRHTWKLIADSHARLQGTWAGELVEEAKRGQLNWRLCFGTNDIFKGHTISAR
jgi:hypothetical protein